MGGHRPPSWPQTPRATHGPLARMGSWLEPPVTWRPRRPGQEKRAGKEQQQRRDAPHLQSQSGGAYRYALLSSPVCRSLARPQPNSSSQRGEKKRYTTARSTALDEKRKNVHGRSKTGWRRGAPRTLGPGSSPVPQPSARHPQTQAPPHRTERPATRRRRYGDCVSPLAASTAAIQRLAAALASKRRVPPKSAVSDSRGMWSYSTE